MDSHQRTEHICMLEHHATTACYEFDFKNDCYEYKEQQLGQAECTSRRLKWRAPLLLLPQRCAAVGATKSPGYARHQGAAVTHLCSNCKQYSVLVGYCLHALESRCSQSRSCCSC
jgi:hypothetical protein